jgi:hypothetical protein
MLYKNVFYQDLYVCPTHSLRCYLYGPHFFFRQHMPLCTALRVDGTQYYGRFFNKNLTELPSPGPKVLLSVYPS